jgi:hypothetical protein
MASDSDVIFRPTARARISEITQGDVVMSTSEQIVKNESLDDIVTVFSLFNANPHLDMTIRRYNRELISEYGALEMAYARLLAAGVLAHGDKGLAAKGPNWKAPKFMIENRYS